MAIELRGNNGASVGILATGLVDFSPDADSPPEKRLSADWRSISSNFRQRQRA